MVVNHPLNQMGIHPEHQPFESMYLPLKMVIFQGTNISPKNWHFEDDFPNFPRWDMLIPWRVSPIKNGYFPAIVMFVFGVFPSQHLRALQVDGRRSLFDQFDPRPKRVMALVLWCLYPVPVNWDTAGGAEIRKITKLRWRIDPIIYRVFCTSQVIVWDFWTLSTSRTWKSMVGRWNFLLKWFEMVPFWGTC